MRKRAIILATLVMILLSGSTLSAGHTLASRQREVLDEWLRAHPRLRLATIEDCACAEDVAALRRGYGGDWKSVPDYQPYVATGDFNSDRIVDFAVVLIDRSVVERKFTFVVFNGPHRERMQNAAFLESGLDLAHQGLFFGPPRPTPYRLLLGAFESEGGVLEPKGSTYSWVYEDP